MSLDIFACVTPIGREVARVVLHVDPEQEPDPVRRPFDTIVTSPATLARLRKRVEEPDARELNRGEAMASAKDPAAVGLLADHRARGLLVPRAKPILA